MALRSRSQALTKRDLGPVVVMVGRGWVQMRSDLTMLGLLREGHPVSKASQGRLPGGGTV